MIILIFIRKCCSLWVTKMLVHKPLLKMNRLTFLDSEIVYLWWMDGWMDETIFLLLFYVYMIFIFTCIYSSTHLYIKSFLLLRVLKLWKVGTQMDQNHNPNYNKIFKILRAHFTIEYYDLTLNSRDYLFCLGSGWWLVPNFLFL